MSDNRLPDTVIENEDGTYRLEWYVGCPNAPIPCACSGACIRTVDLAPKELSERTTRNAAIYKAALEEIAAFPKPQTALKHQRISRAALEAASG